MRASRIIILILVVVVVAMVGLYAFAVLLSPASGGSNWNSAAGYPLQVSGTLGVAGQQCINSTAYILCIGGLDANGGPRNEVYISSAISSSSSNVSSWTLGSHQYPDNINGQACVAYSGYLYCVGGTYDDNGDDVASSYYAPIGSGGALGAWSSTTAYPIPIDSHYCTAWSGYIYCVGGNNETDGTNADAAPSNSVWYAQLSSLGIGPWDHTTAYPGSLSFPSCFGANGYIYCLGGADINSNSQSADYYATLSSAGVGTWIATTAYPVQETGQACAISSGYMYCVGGETAGGQSPSYTNAVYYAPVSSGGIGTWKQAGSYPLSAGTTCVVNSGYMYCVGGFDGSSVGENSAVYYSPLASFSSVTASG